MRMPAPCSLAAVAAPTPETRPTGSGCRNANSVPGSITSRPSGLAIVLASLATTFVLATPTLIGRPTCSRTVRLSVTAICSGEPEIRSRPVTSRNASSIEMRSTTGAVRSKIAHTARLAST